MQEIGAKYHEVAFREERGPQINLPQLILIAAAVASVGWVSALALRSRLSPPSPAVVVLAPPAALAPTAPVAEPQPAPEMSAADFGPMIIEPGWLTAAKTPTDGASLTSLKASATSPSLNNAPAEQPVPATVTARLPDVVPLPPTRDVPEVADTFPMPPPRPPELRAPVIAVPERQAAPSGVANAPAPAGNGSVFQRLFGFLTRPQGPLVAPATPATRAVAPPAPVAAPPPAVAAAPLDARTGGGRSSGPSPLAFFSQGLFENPGPKAGYDRYTAIYDISARTVYMPDGTRIEAHSGLGDRLDDPRYVHERATGATPPHVYELTMRESLFHGVQALRLNPVGDGGVYGRDGFLAHPYMLGPNGDSNGCVSVKDYEAFLRAYQNGQIKRLAVVAGL